MLTESYVAGVGQTVFTFTYDLISANYLTITIDDVVETDWTLTGAQEITFGGTVVLAGGETVAISRSTPIDEALVDFAGPATLRQREFDLAIQQLLHNLQEQDASSAAVLLKNLAGTQWDGEGLPLVNLADYADDAAAATRGWVDSQILASGNLPTPGGGDIGKGIAVQLSGLWGLDRIGEAMISATMPAQADTLLGQLGGFLAYSISDTAAPVWTNAASRIPLSMNTAVGEFFRVSPVMDANTFDFVVGAGDWEITVKGSVRNLGLYDGGVEQISSARVALTNETGATVYDDSGVIRLSVVQNAASNFQGTGAFTLKHILNVPSGVGRFNVRAVYDNLDDVTVDQPLKVFCKEIR